MFFLVCMLSWHEVYFGEWVQSKADSLDFRLLNKTGKWQGFFTYTKSPKHEVDVEALCIFEGTQFALRSAAIPMIGHLYNETMLKLTDRPSKNADSIKVRVILDLNRTTTTVATNPFQLSHYVSGSTQFVYGDLLIAARQVNYTMILIESRIYGAISGIFTGLISILNSQAKIDSYSTVSPVCLSFICAYDIGYASVHHFVGSITRANKNLFLCENVVCWISFLSHFWQCTNAWRDHYELLADRNGTASRVVWSQTLLTMIIVTFFDIILADMFSGAFTESHWSFRLFSMLLITSCWVPQIFKSVITGAYHVFQIWYPWCLTLLRLGELWFVFCRNNGILHYTKDPIFVAIISLWSLLQLTILTCQHLFGGRFFLPARYRLHDFDYYAETVDPGTTCPICLSEIKPTDVHAVTPCHHAFHDDCLRQWLEVDSICPYCRQPIPPMIVPVQI